jgi:hypothetical protein
MPHRLINIDYGMIMLNATSLGTLGLAWFSDNLNTLGGFLVMLSVAYLNFAKARNLRAKGKKENEDKKRD